jgi:hypothetical protein
MLCIITGYYCQILMKTEFSRQISEKFSNIKFHEDPSSGSRVVPCGRTDGHRDMTKLTVAFRNFANASKNVSSRNSFWEETTQNYLARDRNCWR